MSFPDGFPPSEKVGDSTAAAENPQTPKTSAGGRPRLASDNPKVEAKRAAERARKERAKLRRSTEPAGQRAPVVEDEPEPIHPVDDEDEPAQAGPKEKNEAAAAVKKGAQSKRDRGGKFKPEEPRSAPVGREKGWLRKLLEEVEPATGRAVSQLRHLALSILERDGLAWAQECLSDPSAKDSDRAKAFDLVAKMSAGYITPDMAGSEDVPELPAPIFELSEGELPGEQMVGSLAEEDAGIEEDGGGPQLTSSTAPQGSTQPVVKPSAGPMPHMGAA